MVIIIIPCVIFIIKIKMWKGREGANKKGEMVQNTTSACTKGNSKEGFNSPLEYLPLCTPC